MSKLFWSLRITLILLLLAGCAKKELYRFDQSFGGFENAGKKEQKDLPLPDLKKLETVAPMPEESIKFSAAIDLPSAPVKSVQKSNYTPLKTEKTTGSIGQVEAKSGNILFKPSIQKQIKKAEKAQDNRSVHKLVKLGLAFSLGGVFLHVFGFIITGIGGSFMLLAMFSAIVGIILSWLGYKRIRKNPEQYSGRGWAIAGALIGLLLLLLYLYVIVGFMSLDNIAS